MQRRVEVVNWTRGRDQLFRGGLVGSPRVGQRCRGGFQSIQIANAGFIRNRQQDDVATLLAVTDREDLNAGTGGGERAGISVSLLGAEEFSGSPR